MNKWYELWNIKSGNLVASYKSLSSAVLNLGRTAAIRPPSWFEDKELIAEHEDDSEPDVIAEGMDLYSLAQFASPSLQHRGLTGMSYGHGPSPVLLAPPGHSGDSISIKVSGNWSGQEHGPSPLPNGMRGNANVGMSNVYDHKG